MGQTCPVNATILHASLQINVEPNKTHEEASFSRTLFWGSARDLHRRGSEGTLGADNKPEAFSSAATRLGQYIINVAPEACVNPLFSFLWQIQQVARESMRSTLHEKHKLHERACTRKLE